MVRAGIVRYLSDVLKAGTTGTNIEDGKSPSPATPLIAHKCMMGRRNHVSYRNVGLSVY